jgi:hypothetical protein
MTARKACEVSIAQQLEGKEKIPRSLGSAGRYRGQTNLVAFRTRIKMSPLTPSIWLNHGVSDSPVQFIN